MDMHDKITSEYSKHILKSLREVHGDKLLKYRDDELLVSYNNYLNSKYYNGIRSKNFLYFIW